jgi:hydrogenase-4 component F
MNELACLTLLPTVMAILSLFNKDVATTRKLSAFVIWFQLAIVLRVLLPVLTGDIARMDLTNGMAVDTLGTYFILLTTFIVSCCVTHANYFFEAAENKGEKYLPHQLRVFYACTNLFLVAMTCVFLCDNLGYLWIAIEATTLSSAPLVYFERNKHALEATWKYLIVCSVGIAFALLGTVFIFAASQRGTSIEATLNVTELIAHASVLNFPLLRLGFIFCLLGYGTKAGIVPLHTWLPDAHSEAPAPASAMLSGSLLNCALFGIWKVSSILLAADPQSHAFKLVALLGTITVVAASLLLLRQQNFKRLWAYSSIENVGLMVFAIGLGSGPLFFLQAVNHSLAKVSLFLLAGNIIQATGTKKLNKLHGLIENAPIWAAVLALSSLAVAGAPPFGAFVAEMSLLTLCMNDHRYWLALAITIALAISFLAILSHVGKVILGVGKPEFTRFKDKQAAFIPAILISCSLIIGLTVNTTSWLPGVTAPIIIKSMNQSFTRGVQ